MCMIACIIVYVCLLACMHMYSIATYVFYCFHTGGAMEMILTGGIVVKDNDGQSQWYTILGYLFLLGNTLCMVRCAM